MDSLLTLTDSAAVAIKSIYSTEKMGDDTRLRVKVVGGGCSGFSYEMEFDEITVDDDKVRPAVNSDPVKEGDRLITEKGIHIVVDEMSLMYLVGTEIDYVDTLMATGFKFNNPMASTTCGCGNSFAV